MFFNVHCGCQTMLDAKSTTLAWKLLTTKQRHRSFLLLFIVIIAALASAGMVTSIVPFLQVLTDSSYINNNSWVRWIYESAGFTTEYSFLIALGFSSIVVILLANFIQIISVYAVSRYSNMVMHSISCRLLASYLSQPYEYFLSRNTGEMGTRILSESQQIVQQFYRPFSEATAAFFTIMSILGVLIWFNPFVSAAAFLVIGSLYGGTYAVCNRIVSRLGRQRMNMNQLRFRMANESLGGVKEIKMIGRENAYVKRFRDPSYRMADSLIKMNVIGQFPKYIMQVVAFGGMISLCLILLEPSSSSPSSSLSDVLPTLGVFAFAGQRLIPELQKLYVNLTTMKFGAPAVSLVYEDLASTDTRSGLLPETPPTAFGLRKGLYLDDVWYRYPSADNFALRGVTAKIVAGSRIGVVGTTGAGKSTFADVVLGLLVPQQGKIIVDDFQIHDHNRRCWQQTVGYVPQNIYLSDSSLAENIALGVMKEEIDLNKVRRASSIARLHEFVENELDSGYDTIVGERGVRLSGGQKQRVGIARAMYHDADLILFDEATSALDNRTEHEVVQAIEDLPGDKTVIMIAHRLSTIQNCDFIMVFDSGKLVGFDRWETLYENNLVFRNIAELA